MKASRIVLLSGAVFLALLIIVGLVLVRVSVRRDMGQPATEEVFLSGETARIEVETRGVGRLYIVGGWKTILSQGNSSRGEIRIPVELEEALEVRRSGDELTISLRRGFRPGSSSAYLIELELASLQSLQVEGAGEIELRDFDEDQLALRLEGAANIRAAGVRADELVVKAAGACNLDLVDSLFVNARLELEGASNADIQMGGGELSGRVAGIASVEYGGKVSSETIRTEGVASVRRR